MEPIADVEAEKSTLGSALLSKAALEEIRDIIEPGDFYRPAHATIYETVLALADKGEPVDPTTVLAALQTSGELTRVGGGEYLHELLSVVPTAANAAYYARLLLKRR